MCGVEYSKNNFQVRDYSPQSPCVHMYIYIYICMHAYILTYLGPKVLTSGLLSGQTECILFKLFRHMDSEALSLNPMVILWNP